MTALLRLVLLCAALAVPPVAQGATALPDPVAGPLAATLWGRAALVYDYDSAGITGQVWVDLDNDPLTPGRLQLQLDLTTGTARMAAPGGGADLLFDIRLVYPTPIVTRMLSGPGDPFAGAPPSAADWWLTYWSDRVGFRLLPQTANPYWPNGVDARLNVIDWGWYSGQTASFSSYQLALAPISLPGSGAALAGALALAALISRRRFRARK